jgi:hypothetical protein
MHNPMYMYEIVAKDRVRSYHQQVRPGRSEKPMQDSKAGLWLETMQSGLHTALSRPTGVARRAAADIRSWIAKSPAPQEQCC